MDFNSTITGQLELEIYIIWVLYTIIGYLGFLSSTVKHVDLVNNLKITHLIISTSFLKDSLF